MKEKRIELFQSIVPFLCDWFEKDHRQMYWRSHPLPYYVWISEIMLQQTRVEAVREYFARFIQELPDIKSLAMVDTDKLLKLWEGLGYYNRAKNLKKAAIVILEEYNGKMPSEYKELLKLPGIGEYTAGAIASIAFGQAEPVVDGNVLRVLMRLTENHEDILKEKVKRELREDLKQIIPKEKPGIFNQALMELGAVVCVPNGLPKCLQCPIKIFCQAREQGIEHDLSYAQSLPWKAPKKERQKEDWTIFLFERDGKIAVGRRAEKGLLANMWEFPMLSGRLKKSELEMLLEEAGFRFETIEELGEAKHIFSHIEWHMTGYFIRLSGNPMIVAEQNRYNIQEERKELVPILEDLLKERNWETPAILKKEYSMPSAFKVYKQKLGI